MAKQKRIWLSIRTRQTYLKTLGYYKGVIDGISGPLTTQAYQELQNDYFIRVKDKDSKYGNNTDVLLRNVWNFRSARHFKLSEFRCHCNGKYCTGYPEVVSPALIGNLDLMRDIYGSLGITSGLRCYTWNRLIGGVNGSAHTKGKAADVNNRILNATLSSRKNGIEKWLSFSGSQMGYCNGYMRYAGRNATPYKSRTMGISVHLQVA